jgi:SAM-dependent methyltransferase
MYSQIAQQFDKTRYKVWPCVAEFLTTVHVGALLEAGVGNGKNLAYAAELGFQTSGFDICPELVAIAAQRCPSADIYVHDIAEPLTHTYDTILCIAVLHHIQSETGRRAALANLLAALRPGGSLLLTVWSYETFGMEGGRTFQHGINMVPWKNGDGALMANRYYYIYDLAEFTDLVRSTGCNYSITWEKQNWVAILKA